MNNKVKIAVGAAVAVALLAAGGGYYYFQSKTHSPGFALETAEKAVTEHDKTKFYKVVNVDSVLNNSYDGIVDGLTDSDTSMTSETREAVKNFTQMLKAPLMTSFKNAIDSYVETGDFKKAENLGVNELLERTGIDKIEFRKVDNVTINPENENEAFADVTIFQPEIGQEFLIQVVLNKNEGQWQVVRLQNFQDFISQIHKMRRVKIEEYLTKSSEINSRHDKTVREAEQKYSSILSFGSLGQESTRSDLQNLMLDVVKKDWESRKQELFSLSVPKGAETLQNLRLKICDLEIGYAEDYAKWMEDKKASTIKSAEEKHRQAQILTVEAAAIVRRMTNN